MANFKTTSLADRVYEKLENDIIFGVYPRGEILTELKLVEQLGVSRTPIREALRRLEQVRLIEETGKGSVVLGITEEDLEDIMNIRLKVEGLASRYAAANATAEDLQELRHIMDLQDFYREKADTDRIRETDDQFHAAIYRMSRRNVIIDTLLPLHRKCQRYRRASIENRKRLDEMVTEHRRICDAIIAGDAALAEKLTTEHIANAKASIMGRIHYNG